MNPLMPPPQPKKKKSRRPALQAEELIKQSNESRYGPQTDGVDHINIHLWAKTPLGVMLSSEAECYFNHPTFGPFRSIEGLFHWITHQNVPDTIREAHGTKMAKRFPGYQPRRIGDIRTILIEAHIEKIMQNRSLITMLQNCTLPFTCYYTNSSGLIIQVYKRAWLIEFFEAFRRHLREHGATPFHYKIPS